MNSNKISKREFIKKCLLCSSGIAMGFSHIDIIAETLHRKLGINYSDELWKWSKEAYYYSKTKSGVRCLNCPNFCDLGEGDTGKCRSRINYKGKLYSIAYGNPCAVHIDPIEKKPLNHFLPGTKAFSIAAAGCGLSCLNCQNWSISQFSPKQTKNYDLMPGNVVEQAILQKCETIAYTYSEPLTWYEYTLDAAKIGRERGVKNILKSSGYGNKKPVRRLAKYLDAANIDLKSFSDEIYSELTGGKLQPILDTLKILKEEGVWLEITNLVVPTWTDNFDMIKKMCEWLVKNNFEDSPLHFSRFHPMFKLTHLPSTPVSTLEKAHKIAIEEGLKYVYVGNVPGHSTENTYCHNCGKVVINRRGYTILGNNIVNNKCKFCGTIIPGVWG